MALADVGGPAGARLVLTASRGVARTTLAAFAVDLADRQHPLVRALAAGRVTTVPRAALRAAGLELAWRRCIAVPLPARRGRDRLGVVLLDGDGRAPEIAWVSSVLARKLVDLRAAGMLASTERHEREGIRRAEAQVRAERDRLDLIIDSVADPIVVTDANGAMIMTNAPADRLFAARPSARKEERQRVRANDARFSSHVSNLFFIEATGRFRGELALSDPKTGAPVPVEAISGKIVSETGEVTAVVTILHDQTEAVEKARLYAELRLASELLQHKVRDATAALVTQNELLQRQALELEAASSAKSQFLANMSHELRTPLNAILGYTSMLLQGVSGSLSPAVTRQLGRVDSNAKHLLGIINEVLDIARIEAGKPALNVKSFALGDLVEEVVAELEPLIVRAKVTVKVALGRPLPALRSDRSKVKQILMNLLSNALKFTPSGSVTVSARLARRKTDVLLAVTDTGIGISRKNQETVFEDFRQVESSPAREYGGTGLGLAICRRLATHLGGDIELVSKLGKGSTFTLVLPLKGIERSDLTAR